MAATTTAPSVEPTGLNSDTSHGKTVINDQVVAKIAGIAAREVAGVHDLGSGAARAIGAIRGAIAGTDQGQGISVEVGERQVAADIVIVAEYPVPLQTISDGVRSAVVQAIESLVGLEVTEVDITIADVHIPADDDADSTTESRVR